MSETVERVKNSQSKSFRKLNPHLFGTDSAPVILNHGGEDDEEHDHITALANAEKIGKPKKRIRQSDKPLLNKTESEFQRILLLSNPEAVAQSIRFKLSTGLHYTPDFFSLAKLTAWEVKGKHAWEDSLVKLRMAAKVWTSVKWFLVWKENGSWQSQLVVP